MDNNIQTIDKGIVEVGTTNFVLEQEMSSIKLDCEQNFVRIYPRNDIRDKIKPIKISFPPPDLVSLSQAPYKTSVKQNLNTNTDPNFNKNKLVRNSVLKSNDNEHKFVKRNLRMENNSQTCDLKAIPKKNQLKKSASAFPAMTSQQIVYDQYWDSNSINQGLRNGILFQGKLRINPRSYEDAFLTDPVKFYIFLN